MKKLIFVLAAVVVSFTVNAQTTMVQKDSLATPVQQGRSINLSGEVTPVNMEYYELLGGREHDQLVVTTSDNLTFWKARTIYGWHFGAVVGGSLDGYIAGLTVGRTEKHFDFDVTVRMGQHEFHDKKYHAPSMFVEFKPTLVKWGKNNLQTNKIYVGARAGYQFAKGSYSISEETEDYRFSYESKQQGSGYAVGGVIGWERRSFMSGHRFGVQIAAYTYQMDWSYTFNSNTMEKVQQRGYTVEATIIYKFVTGKTVRNY